MRGMRGDVVQIAIDGNPYQVEERSTILEACREAHINIPTLCFMEGLNEAAACSLCVVEVKNARTLLRACVTRVVDGMEIFTRTKRVLEARKTILELILANHPRDCLSCDRNQNCELQKMADALDVHELSYERTRTEALPLDETSLSIVRDPNKCILCRRCVSVCETVQSVHAIDFINRGLSTEVATYLGEGLGYTQCVNCGQCLLVCPTGAITEKNHIGDVWSVLQDPEKFVIVQTAPAVRAAIGEEFELAAGTPNTGKMVAALRKMGFNKVFDTQFTADLTIMEEGSEFLDRLNNGGVLPLITSCSPGWVKFAEHFFPGVLDHVSSCKSPQQMFGAVAKTYYAEKLGMDPRKMVVVSIMPCTAKKFEAQRPEMQSASEWWKRKMKGEKLAFRDVDFVLTTREAARMIKEAGIQFKDLPDEGFDDPLGVSTGAGTIFGATGGVMEAALRTVYEIVTGRELARLEFKQLRGLDGIKSTEVDVGGKLVKVAVASGLGNARKLLEEVQEGRSMYHFIEIMCCPGGCIGGGGQPLSDDLGIRNKRIAATYAEDEGMAIRKSHDNPVVQALYKEFLEKPLSHLSHELLHTEYSKRPE